MGIVPIFSVAFLCGIILFVSGAPMSIECQPPLDLTTPTMSEIFLSVNDHATSSDETTVIEGEETCPESLLNFGRTQDRSTCPWFTRIIKNNTLFPSSRSEAVCRCNKCIGSDGAHGCELIYTEMMFLRRTAACVNGLYTYEPIQLQIPTGCVCASNKLAQIGSTINTSSPTEVIDI